MTQAPFELAVERYIDAPPEIVFKVWKRTAGGMVGAKALDHQGDRAGPAARRSFSDDHDRAGRRTSPMEGVILEVVPNERVVFTNAFTVGWIPQAPFMVGSSPSRQRARAPVIVPVHGIGTRRRTSNTKQWASTRAGQLSQHNWRSLPRRKQNGILDCCAWVLTRRTILMIEGARIIKHGAQ